VEAIVVEIEKEVQGIEDAIERIIVALTRIENELDHIYPYR